jgi:hypothetical protein
LEYNAATMYFISVASQCVKLGVGCYNGRYPARSKWPFLGSGRCYRQEQ